jgi:hypothetical protein
MTNDPQIARNKTRFLKSADATRKAGKKAAGTLASAAPPSRSSSDDLIQQVMADLAEHQLDRVTARASPPSQNPTDPDTPPPTGGKPTQAQPTSVAQQPIVKSTQPKEAAHTQPEGSRGTLFVVDRGPWADPEDEALRGQLAAAHWKVVDIETTGLSTASEPVKITKKLAATGADTALRTRVITAAWRDSATGALRVEAWDLDTMSLRARRALAAAALSGAVIGHNLAFDLGWLMRLDSTTSPTITLDTMLLAHLIRPEAAVELLAKAQDQGDKIAREIADRSGGWSLEALAYLFGITGPGGMDKGMQKPRHWVLSAPLSAEHYHYATEDVRTTWKLFSHLLGMAPGESSVNDPLKAYRDWEKLVEKPQAGVVTKQYTRLPIHLARLSIHGIPVSHEAINTYVAAMAKEARGATTRMKELEPALAPILDRLANPKLGLNDEAKAALCAAFEARGVAVARSEKAQDPQVGEKDLRGARADQGEAAPLFEALAACNRAAKRAAMALVLRGFAERNGGFDGDGIGRVHSLFAPVTNTGRLSSSEPNLQNLPSDDAFRAIVRATTGHKIISCDYSALDVRVGAALAVREQRRIATALANPTLCDRWYGANAQAFHCAVHGAAEATAEALLDAELRLGEAREYGRTQGRWKEYRAQIRELQILRFSLALHRLLALYGDGDFDAALAELHALSESAAFGWPGESAFRRAFRLGVDVHIYTTLKLNGRDPDAEFAGLRNAELECRIKALKDELGSKRKRGKVANLSLLYAMTPPSFCAHAAKVYGVHMSQEDAAEVVRLWLMAYPEIDLLGASTALRGAERWEGSWIGRKSGNQHLGGPILLYDPRARRVKAKPVWHDATLSQRPIVSAGLNSALNYPDQGSGADLLTRVLDTLGTDHPDLYERVINQVHDELVFEVPASEAEKDAARIRAIMEREGERVLEPYGVPMRAVATVGDAWAH